MKKTDLTTLKIHNLTQAQYDAALAAGLINDNEIYATPAESELPSVTSGDNDKVLQVKNGEWTAVALSTTPTVTDDGNGNVTIIIGG